jgi:osmoprotectant transport system permease protein
MKILFLILLTSFSTQAADQIVVGSKIFTESYILSEIAAQSLETSGFNVNRKLGMGSTGVLFESLKGGAIDVYPDYSGTLAETILKNPALTSLEDIDTALKPLGLTISKSLGFNDTYALAVKEEFAQKNNLTQISDLKKIQSEIRPAFSYEFMDRKDGYNGLVTRYGLNFVTEKVRRMEHSLVYQALNQSAVDVIEIYSTDANIEKYNLRVLKDDKNYFPTYQAVWVARLAFVETHPEAWKNLQKFENSIDEKMMTALNAKADIAKKDFSSIASEFLGHEKKADHSRYQQIWQRTQEHLWLVSLSLLFSIVVGVPLGILAARYQLAGQGILLTSALIQTIPALALLCFLIPAFSVGSKPALVALCLYSLLPVVLNTFTGIRGVDPKHIENAKAFGLNRLQILTRITLPIASPTILAGVKTSAVVSIGTVTLAVLVGAGGYGALIVSGLSLNDNAMILRGAIPAALMALVTHVIFAMAEAFIISKGLRKQS